MTCRSVIAVMALASALAVSVLGPSAQAQVGLRVNPAPINQGLNVLNSQVSRSVNQLSTQVTRGMNQVNRSVNRGINQLNSYSYRPPVQVRTPRSRPGGLGTRAVAPRSSFYAPQTLQPQLSEPGSAAATRQDLKLSKEQIESLRAHQAELASRQTAYGILPAAALAGLTEDHIGLQNAAQRVALDGQIGEVIDWTYEGVSGSVTVKGEHTIGTMRCRDFVQSISRDGETKEASGTLCQRGMGQWARSLF